MNVSDIQNQYIEKLLRDMRLDRASAAERQQAAAMLQRQFQRVVLRVFVQQLSTQQRSELRESLSDPDRLETAVERLAAEVPGLLSIVEQELLAEYQLLKAAMEAGDKDNAKH